MEKSKVHNLSWLAIWWSALGLLGVTTLAFRIVKTSNLSSSFRVEDVPMLDAFDQNYAAGFWGLVVLALIGLYLGYGVFCNSDLRPIWRRIGGLLLAATGLGMAITALPTDPFGGRPDLSASSYWDWLVVTGYALTSLCLVFLLPREKHLVRSASSVRRMPRASLIYLMAIATLMISAVVEHMALWDDWIETSNYASKTITFFFGGEEKLFEANLLLYTTSLLFVSLTALLSVLGYYAFRRFVTKPAETSGLSDGRARIAAAMMAVAWAAALGLPGLTKLLPEIEKEGAWLFPIAVMTVLNASFGVIIYAALISLRADESEGIEEGQRAKWRPSDLAFVAFASAAIYPVTRLILPKSTRWRLALSTLLGGLIVLAMAITMAYLTDWFQFDDWRDMVKRAQLPVLRVAFSLASVWALYTLVGLITRLFILRPASESDASSEAPPRSAFGSGLIWSLRVLALALVIASSFPFWGQSEISENTHARAVEFSDRHGFEVQFLNSLFDFDRDGYSAILHGSDPDDFDASIQGFGMPPLKMIDLTPPEVEIVDADKAKAFPNLVILYLEGFTNDSLNFMGRRNLRPKDLQLPADWKRDDLVSVTEGQRSPTPFMDDIAMRGTAFERCRTVYPSTWDGWMQTQSGHHMMVTEFSTVMLGNDHYSRYNVIDKLCREVGISRFCYANSSPWAKIFVSTHNYDEDFEHELSTGQSKDDKENGIWKGDNQTSRIVRFIDSLEEGERFFITEHMEDGHFPWWRTTDTRAREIGEDVNYHYNGTFDWAEEDRRSSSHGGFLQEVTRIDSQIGRITNALKKKGLWDNTMVVIIGDHGCQWHEHQRRYYVSHLYEEAINPPLFMKVPGLSYQGIKTPAVQQVDLVPTLLELGGARISNPEDYPLDGVSLVPYLKGEETEADAARLTGRSLFLKTHYDKVGYIHEGRYKLIADRPFGTVRLFDLLKDPKEMYNIADDEPELLAEMKTKMAELSHDKMALLVGVSPPKVEKSSSPTVR